MTFLIVGLGNPGAKYEKTRHNAGFMVVDAFCEKWGFSQKSSLRMKGKLATGVAQGQKWILLKPSTYMNLSGESLRACVNYYKPEQFVVVTDDVYLDLGRLRLRSGGSCGGHNGLLSVQQALQTEDYLRLKVGVGPQKGPQPLEDFVLEAFTKAEQEFLGPVIDKAVATLECWASEGLEKAMQMATNV